MPLIELCLVHCNGLYHGLEADDMTMTDERPLNDPTISTCRSCGAAVWWRVNPSGARQPFDYDLRNRAPTDMPHHATCPQGREWSRRRQP